MSILQPSSLDIQESAYNSMRSGAGFEPDVAADLGFTTPDNYETQVGSGQKVGELIKQTNATQIGSYLCGDCLAEVEPGDYCVGGHIAVNEAGRVKTLR